MTEWNRREWMAGLAGSTFLAHSTTSASITSTATTPSEDGCQLALRDFQPKSMLKVDETFKARSSYPVIDSHTHLSFLREEGGELTVNHLISPEEAITVMDRKNIALMVNLTGGYGSALEDNLEVWAKPHPDRFAVFVQPWFEKIVEPNYPQFQADEIEKAARLGAKGIKVLKVLGLFLKEEITKGPLVKVDDPRFDPMWEVAGAYDLPVGIHISDPEAFFLPTDRFNERYEELSAHPDWSFHGEQYPSDRELQEARVRVMQRHPRTKFIALHVADAENLDYVSDCMNRCPNMYVEMGARIGELGRQPRRAKKFFEEYQDRILFGTDAVPNGYETPQQIFGEALYEIYYRFLETDDEYFDYAPADVPPQGRWKIYGVDLPGRILKKVYYDNAARLLGMPALA